MNKEYVIVKLAAMTTEMYRAALDKVEGALDYGKNFLEKGKDILPVIERAAEEGNAGAKLFLQQKGATNSELYALKRIKKLMDTRTRLNNNTNRLGEYLGINNEEYNLLKGLSGEDKFVIPRDVSRSQYEIDKSLPDILPFKDKIVDSLAVKSYMSKIKKHFDEINNNEKIVRDLAYKYDIPWN